jgi:hypothetical protein
MKRCYICKGESNKPVLDALHHFKLINFVQLEFIKGTYQTFGLRSVLTLVSPLLNTILNWRHMGKELRMEE